MTMLNLVHLVPAFSVCSLKASLRSLSTTAWVRNEHDYETARQWYENRASNLLPAHIGELSYARSSGPGGQNVNKVNSKAQLRVPFDQLLPLLPTILHQAVRSCRYAADKSDSLLIQSDESRKQSTNKDNCYRKLNELVAEIFHDVVPGETSPEQKAKVKRLQQADNEARLKMKKIQSSKKASRGKGRGDD